MPRITSTFLLATAMALVMLLPAVGRVPSAVATDDEAVLNPSGLTDLSSWTARSGAGVTTLRRLSVDNGPPGVHNAVEVRRRTGGPVGWSYTLLGLRDPQTFFQVGQTYRMSIYVRDVNASGAPVGMLLANGNYRNRPTVTEQYQGFPDSSWHLLSRTFVCTADGFPDTAMYLALPADGALRWQFAAASVRRVDAPAPPQTQQPPSTVLTFDGPAGSPPDNAHWNHQIGGHGWGNDELQTYTDSTTNSQLNGAGQLVITARREDATGPDGIARQYTSARLTTQDKVVVPPGSYVEALIRPPVGAGVWPAFWLLGANIDEVGWPASGELDVMEVVGARPTVVHSATHQSSATDANVDVPYGWEEAGGTVDLGHLADSRTHAYGVYFDGQTVRFYLDRVEHLALWADDAVISGRTWPFDAPHFLLLNVAVGGTGDPSDTEFPRSMTVDEVAIWPDGTPF